MLSVLEKTAGGQHSPLACADQTVEDKHIEDDWMRCSVCAEKITQLSNRMIIEGGYIHRHVNPEGLVFEIGSFAQAVGTSVVGERTEYFSWFRGYAWQVAVCASCAQHLGWFFRAQFGQTDFYGLILNRLAAGGRV